MRSSSAASRQRASRPASRRRTNGGRCSRVSWHGPVDISGGAEKLRQYAADLRGLIGKHVVQARQLLRAVLAGQRLVCEPYDDETGRDYRFDANGVLTFNVGKNSLEFPVASVVSAMVV